MIVKYTNPLILKVHPLNEELVPPMTPEEFEALVLDVRERGVQVPLDVLAGTNLVIDGRNRLQAAIKAKSSEVPVMEREIEEGELPLYIISRVGVHRHMAKAQKAAVAAEYTEILQDKLKRGRPQKKGFKIETFSGKAIHQAAQRFGVANSYIQTALNLKKLVPESFESMKAGELTIKDAQAIIARARVERSPEQLIPELQKLVEDGKLAHEAAWHLSQLTHAEQSVIRVLVKDKGIASLNESTGRALKITMRTARDTEEWKQLQEDLLALQKKKRHLEQKLAESRRQASQYLDELEELKNKADSAASEQPEVVARIGFLEQELSRYKDAEDILSGRLQEKQDEMEELRDQFLEVRDQKETLEQKNRELASRLQQIFELISKSRRGRKRKDIYQKQIDAQNRRLARAREQIRDLREEKEKLSKTIGQLSNRVINLAARREHMQAQSALRNLIGILRGPELKRLPDHILLHEGDVIGALELLNEAMGAMEDLLTRANKSARKLFRELEVIDDENSTQETGGSPSTGNAP